MENHPATPSEQLDEELVAYLDGQLDAEAARRVEHRLAADGAWTYCRSETNALE